MKRLFLFASSLMMVLCLASCGKKDYKSFIGTWGVKHIEYYNIDYAGNPIQNTIKVYDLTPGDMDNGIDLIFREDKTGEMRDRSRDTLYLDWNSETEVYETIIICPDTTVITPFTYSYNPDDGLLFLNMQVEYPYIYQMEVNFIDNETFEYINEYDIDYVEKATLVRYSKETRGAKSTPLSMKRHPKSLFSNY